MALGRASSKAANQVHRFLAARTKRHRPGSGRRQFWSFPIQERQDALASGFCGRAEPAEITDSLEAARKNVLEEAADKLLGRDAGGLPLAILAVLVTEGDLMAIVGKDALGSKGGFVDVIGQVFQSGNSGAHSHDVNDPTLLPDFSRDLGEQFGGLLESQTQTSSETASQDLFWQEVIWLFATDPAQSIGTKSRTGDNVVDVQMEPKLARPGLKNAQETQLGAEVFGGGGDILEGAGSFLEEQIVELLLVRPEESAQLSWQSKGDQEIRGWKQLGLLPLDPVGGVLMAALGAGPMMAGMVSEVEVTTITAVSFPAQLSGAARQNGLDGALVRRKNLLAKTPLVLWPVAGQDLGQLDHSKSGRYRVID